MSFLMFTRETRVPTTPAHQQPMVEIVTCPAWLRTERVKTTAAKAAPLLGAS